MAHPEVLDRTMTYPSRNQILGGLVLLALILCFLMLRYARVLWWNL